MVLRENMRTAKEGELLLVKLDLGEDLFSSLERALLTSNLRCGVIAAGIGVLKDFELGYYDLKRKVYLRRRYRAEYELLSIQGSASLLADPKFHIHCTVGGRDHQVRGGHLFGGTIGASGEVYVLGLREVGLGRRLNEATGLKEVSFE
jgi:hypothetical protein